MISDEEQMAHLGRVIAMKDLDDAVNEGIDPDDGFDGGDITFRELRTFLEKVDKEAGFGDSAAFGIEDWWSVDGS